METPDDNPPIQRAAPVAFLLYGLMALGVVLGFCLDNEWGAFFEASWWEVPMALLGVLAYLGLKSRVARAFAWLLLGTVLAGLVVMNSVFVAAASNSLSSQSLTPEGKRTLVFVTVISVMAALTVLLPHFNGCRRLLSALSGNTEWNSVRVMAFGGVMASTLLLFVPLVTLGKEPLLALLPKVLEGRFRPAGPRGEMYSLSWGLLAAFLAVGLGVRRNWRECLERLGLVRLSPRQIGMALGLTALVLLMDSCVAIATDHVWSFFSWPRTDEKLYEALFDGMSSPVGALVIG